MTEFNAQQLRPIYVEHETEGVPPRVQFFFPPVQSHHFPDPETFLTARRQIGHQMEQPSSHSLLQTAPPCTDASSVSVRRVLDRDSVGAIGTTAIAHARRNSSPTAALSLSTFCLQFILRAASRKSPQRKGVRFVCYELSKQLLTRTRTVLFLLPRFRPVALGQCGCPSPDDPMSLLLSPLLGLWADQR